MTRGKLLALLIAAIAVLQPGAAHAADKVNAITVLNSLPVSSETRSGYDRDAFRHWSTDPDSGCDTRELVLIEERTSGTVRGCTVVGGRWLSRYDGVATTNPSSFDVDHMVPLAEAWDSGAWRWSSSTRESYANDLGYAGSLIAVSASSNRSKGDRDPSEWLPARNRCGYAKTWIAVKSRWRLSVDTVEKSALNRILANCSPMMILPPRATITTDSNATNPSAPSPSGSGSASSQLDPRYRTCGDANSHGYGPYVKGKDAEYEWYIDRDSDGVVCET